MTDNYRNHIRYRTNLVKIFIRKINKFLDKSHNAVFLILSIISIVLMILNKSYVCDAHINVYIWLCGNILISIVGLLFPLELFRNSGRNVTESNINVILSSFIILINLLSIFVNFFWFVFGHLILIFSGNCSSIIPQLIIFIVVYIIFIYIKYAIYITTNLILFSCCCVSTCIGFMLDILVYLDDEDTEKPTINEINTLPINIYTVNDMINNNYDEGCCICIDKYEIENEMRILKCRHHFHKDCCDKWLKTNRTCPVCRQDVFL